MSTRCGRVEPIIRDFIAIQFVGEKLEKYGMKNWEQCKSEIKIDSHLCEKHTAEPMKIMIGKELVDFTPSQL